ncbi:MAG TPA: phosphatidate cytidylyltransferase [Actinomycetota bacterium]|nr:phosphatidate cytidylyltransferase [Actinomycetota bacterium]
MPEDEERNGEGEDLFEDLDKFFAPIQDVDWPESSEGKGSEQAAGAERRDEPSRGDPGQPEVASDETEDEEAASAGPGAGEPAVGEDPFATRESPPEAGVEGEQDEVGSFLFEAGAEGDDVEEAEAGSRGYVDLPGDEPGIAELIEETESVEVVAERLPEKLPERLSEDAPDIEAVEAAADHFAESVRDEVRVEPEPPAPQPTEEVAIAQLLGEEGAADAPEASRTVRVGAEGFGGPSWQEPTAIEVGAESERGGAGRDVPTAFLTGLVLAGLAVGAILIGPGAFAIFAGIVVLFALGEFYLAMQKRHFQPATALGLVSGALILGAGYYRGENAMLAIMALSLFATFLWYMTVPPQHRRNIVSNIAITIFGVAYIPLLAAYALAVLKLPDGEGLTLSIIGLTFVYDTAAFGVGYFWGSRPLAPTISPKKSWEGAIGATLVVIAVAVGVVGSSVSLLDTVGRSVGLAVVVALFAPLGDLAESLIKRDLEIKDMGGILPGHGGVMDRIDSVLFVAPAAFIYLRLILL